MAPLLGVMVLRVLGVRMVLVLSLMPKVILKVGLKLTMKSLVVHQGLTLVARLRGGVRMVLAGM